MYYLVDTRYNQEISHHRSLAACEKRAKAYQVKGQAHIQTHVLDDGQPLKNGDGFFIDGCNCAPIKSNLKYKPSPCNETAHYKSEM